MRPREPRHDHPIRARTRPARPGPDRDHQRAAPADQPLLPAAGLPGRLLGSLAEAEDAVQETYARWYALTPRQRDAIASPGAWLTTVTSRICLPPPASAPAPPPAPPPPPGPPPPATPTTPGKPATPPPSPPCPPPTPPPPPTAAAGPPPPCSPSKAPSRSAATWPTSPPAHQH